MNDINIATQLAIEAYAEMKRVERRLERCKKELDRRLLVREVDFNQYAEITLRMDAEDDARS